MKLDRTQYQAYMFTLNNFDDVMEPKGWYESGKLAFVVWQHEKGESGTDHLQGYLKLLKRARITEMKKFSERAHWEPQKYGSQDACVAYCQKEDTRVAGPWHNGEISVSRKGRRNDIVSLRNAIRDGQSERQICDNEDLLPSFAKYQQFVTVARRVYQEHDRDTQTHGLILWGPPCTGKTTAAHQIAAKSYPEETPFVLPAKQGNTGGHWWDGYDGHSVVIIDEVDGSTFSGRDLCTLFDDKPLVLPKKNGHVSFKAKLVIMTSNKDPDEWYHPEVLARNPGIERRLQLPITHRIQMRKVQPVAKTSYPVTLFQTAKAVVSESESKALSPDSSPSRRSLSPPTPSYVVSSGLGLRQEVQQVLTDDGLDPHPRFQVVQTATGAHAPTFRPVVEVPHDQHAMEALALTSQARAAQAKLGFTADEWIERQRQLGKRKRGEAQLDERRMEMLMEEGRKILNESRPPR